MTNLEAIVDALKNLPPKNVLVTLQDSLGAPSSVALVDELKDYWNYVAEFEESNVEFFLVTLSKEDAKALQHRLVNEPKDAMEKAIRIARLAITPTIGGGLIFATPGMDIIEKTLDDETIGGFVTQRSVGRNYLWFHIRDLYKQPPQNTVPFYAGMCAGLGINDGKLGMAGRVINLSSSLRRLLSTMLLHYTALGFTVSEAIEQAADGLVEKTDLVEDLIIAGFHVGTLFEE